MLWKLAAVAMIDNMKVYISLYIYQSISSCANQYKTMSKHGANFDVGSKFDTYGLFVFLHVILVEHLSRIRHLSNMLPTKC